MAINLRPYLAYILLLMSLTPSVMAADEKTESPEQLQVARIRSIFDGFVTLDSTEIASALLSQPPQTCPCEHCLATAGPKRESFQDADGRPAPCAPSCEAEIYLSRCFELKGSQTPLVNRRDLFDRGFAAFSDEIKKNIDDEIPLVIHQVIYKQLNIITFDTAVGYKKNAVGEVEKIAVLNSGNDPVRRMEIFDARAFFNSRSTCADSLHRPSVRRVIVGPGSIGNGHYQAFYIDCRKRSESSEDEKQGCCAGCCPADCCQTDQESDCCRAEGQECCLL